MNNTSRKFENQTKEEVTKWNGDVGRMGLVDGSETHGLHDVWATNCMLRRSPYWCCKSLAYIPFAAYGKDLLGDDGINSNNWNGKGIEGK